jgi:hypothetical protein
LIIFLYGFVTITNTRFERGECSFKGAFQEEIVINVVLTDMGHFATIKPKEETVESLGR